MDEIEKSAAKVDFNSIDISGIQDSKAPRRKPQFQLLLDLAMQIEAGRIKEPQRPRKAPAAKQTYSKTQMEQMPSPSKDVKMEVGAFAGKLSTKEEHQPTKPFSLEAEKADELVLPKLSTTDQISELEHMIDGLHENSFDYDHIEKIKKEVYALEKQVIQEIMKGKKKRPTKAEQNLIKLRDQRLNEVMAILGDGK